MITDQKYPADRLEVAKEVFDLLRGNGLAVDVFVDFLLAVNDANEAVPVLLHQIAGVEPFIGVESIGAVRRVEVSPHNVGTTHHELAVVGQGELDPRQGRAERVILVSSRRRHGDPAGGLGHAEAAHQLDPVSLEEAEDLRVEITGRRQPPPQTRTDDSPQGRLDLGVVGRHHVHRLADKVKELHPLHWDADEDGDPQPAHLPGQAVDAGILGKAVGRTPEDATSELEEAAECVEEG